MESWSNHRVRVQDPIVPTVRTDGMSAHTHSRMIPLGRIILNWAANPYSHIVEKDSPPGGSLFSNCLMAMGNFSKYIVLKDVALPQPWCEIFVNFLVLNTIWNT